MTAWLISHPALVLLHLSLAQLLLKLKQKFPFAKLCLLPWLPSCLCLLSLLQVLMNCVLGHLIGKESLQMKKENHPQMQIQL